MLIITIDAQIRLWQMISAALPVGAFHYSQGLESAVTQGWVRDEEGALDWLRNGLQRALGHVDLPLLARIHKAWGQGNEVQLLHWNEWVRACRETAELREEEDAMGVALMALADTLDESRPSDNLGYTAMFGVLAVNNQVPRVETLAGFAWAWCENMSLAATKLVPLGHLSGQRMLRALASEINQTVERSMHVPDAEIGCGLPGMLMASALHEVQYSRVFRS